jgi:hypothetical protein
VRRLWLGIVFALALAPGAASAAQAERPEPTPGVLGPARQALRGVVLGVQDGLIRLWISDGDEVLVRPPVAAYPRRGSFIEVDGPSTGGGIFEADRLSSLTRTPE